ncbi:retinol dehydrogenase 13-like isoform X3 [Syngnathoides biaculeatus]|uniref:retinol dehydrogenase 13-like isoform X3 n=1 Tax=Syngnathoides biaculeatus TaxID=300417 RepID=UPI002ADE4A38|nr:retinol dehydrogenase 13-like isoform X3 [Syngnathoides biaculeatus]
MSKYVLPVSAFGTVVGCAVLLKNHMTGGRCPSKAKINGKTVIITGANTGIGKETARELARRGHFLLTNLLLDRLKESAPSRVINLASLAHLVGKMDFEDLNWERRKFNTKQAYCQSKLANVLFTRELAKRLQGTGVTANAVHPGVVSSELGRHTGLHQSQFSTTVLSPLFSLLVKNPELGAQPSIYLAVAEELDGVTGRYYDVLTEKEPAPQAMDEEAARRLWEISSRLVGLEEDEGHSGESGQDNLPAQSRQTHGRNPGAVVGPVGL